MRYKTQYKESYAEGTVNKSFSISKIAFDLLCDEIENQSAFVNDLIIDALQDKDFFKRQLMKQINQAREDMMQKYGKKYELREVD